MKIAIISGSHRENAQSMKVASVVKGILEKEHLETTVFSLSGNPLPLWDQGVWDNREDWNRLLSPIKQCMAESDGFVVISPEWHGQVPAGLKNFFLLMSDNELGHKPALIVGVSSGHGGAYPVAELRMSSYKNNRICYIPEHVIIRDVENVLNDIPGDNDVKSDTYYRARLQWSMKLLKAYALALIQVRADGITPNKKFKNGM